MIACPEGEARIDLDRDRILRRRFADVRTENVIWRHMNGRHRLLDFRHPVFFDDPGESDCRGIHPCGCRRRIDACFDGRLIRRALGITRKPPARCTIDFENRMTCHEPFQRLLKSVLMIPGR